jgi:glycosyltransferase involved in cell wall biosynthesis
MAPPDGSSERVNAIAHPSLRVIRHPYNIGNGAAVKTGIRNARGRRVVLLDAEGQHRVEHIPLLLEATGFALKEWTSIPLPPPLALFVASRYTRVPTAHQ